MKFILFKNSQNIFKSIVVAIYFFNPFLRTPSFPFLLKTKKGNKKIKVSSLSYSFLASVSVSVSILNIPGAKMNTYFLEEYVF